MGISTTPAAPPQRQTTTRPRRPRMDEEQAEANRVLRRICSIDQIRIRLSREDSRIYSHLSGHGGDHRVTLTWSYGGWMVQRRGARRVDFVEGNPDIYAFLGVLFSMDLMVEESVAPGQRRIVFRGH